LTDTNKIRNAEIAGYLLDLLPIEVDPLLEILDGLTNKALIES
jgi:hypothetical protein